MSARAETLRGGHPHLLRAWVAVAALMVAAVLAVALWAAFGSSSESATSTEKAPAPNKAAVTRIFPDSRFGEPIRIGDYVCHQCR